MSPTPNRGVSLERGSGHVSVGDLNLYDEVHGNGPPLMLLAGLR